MFPECNYENNRNKDTMQKYTILSNIKCTTTTPNIFQTKKNSRLIFLNNNNFRRLHSLSRQRVTTTHIAKNIKQNLNSHIIKPAICVYCNSVLYYSKMHDALSRKYGKRKHRIENEIRQKKKKNKISFRSVAKIKLPEYPT